MKAILYKTDGTVTDVTPADGKAFSLETLYSMLECALVEFIPFPDGRSMIGDEEARLRANPARNTEAEKVWAEAYPKEQYPNNNDGLVFGNVLIVTDYPND